MISPLVVDNQFYLHPDMILHYLTAFSIPKVFVYDYIHTHIHLNIVVYIVMYPGYISNRCNTG